MSESQENMAGRIVVGVDGSAQSEAALLWALRQAVRTGARIEAVACWQWPAIAGGVGIGMYPEVDFDLSKVTAEIAQATVTRAVAATEGAHGIEIETRVVDGYPAKVLLQSAAGADLLVVGSRGHGELSGLLLGSVGLHCASHAPCPVLIFRGGPVDHDDQAMRTAPGGGQDR